MTLHLGSIILAALALLSLVRCCWPGRSKGSELIHRAETHADAKADRLAHRFRIT